MNFISTIRLVFRTLLARKGRSFLTILGIVIGVAGVIIIIALGAGAQSLVLGQITRLGTDLLSIQPGKSNEKGPPAEVYGVVVTTLVKEDVTALRSVPHVAAANAVVRGTGGVTWSNKNTDTNFIGTDAAYQDVVSFSMQSGRFFSTEEEQGGVNVVVLGSEVSDQLFGDSGIDPIGQVIKVKGSAAGAAGGIPLRVVGVIAPRGSSFFQNQDDQIFLPLSLAQGQLLGIRHLQSINIKVDSAENVDLTIENVEQALMQRHGIRNEEDADFTVRNIADAISILSTITDALRLFLTAMAAISLIVGGIGILNIMLVTVAERTREIGLRKAVGANTTAIRNQFLLEAAMLTSLGGLGGIIAGIAVSYLAAVVMHSLGYDWDFVISPLSVILAVGISMLTGVLFGLYPAFKAASLNPIEALRYE